MIKVSFDSCWNSLQNDTIFVSAAHLQKSTSWARCLISGKLSEGTSSDFVFRNHHARKPLCTFSDLPKNAPFFSTCCEGRRLSTMIRGWRKNFFELSSMFSCRARKADSKEFLDEIKISKMRAAATLQKQRFQRNCSRWRCIGVSEGYSSVA